MNFSFLLNNLNNMKTCNESARDWKNETFYFAHLSEDFKKDDKVNGVNKQEFTSSFKRNFLKLVFLGNDYYSIFRGFPVIYYYFLLPIRRESTVFRSNFRSGDINGFTRSEIPWIRTSNF